MPTCGAVDLVAKKQGLNVYETPTGWKFFCALFDANKAFYLWRRILRNGSNHVREKDGLWAVVAWLNIIAGIGEANPGTTLALQKSSMTSGLSMAETSIQDTTLRMLAQRVLRTWSRT